MVARMRDTPVNTTYKPDIVILTETWLTSSISDDEIIPPGYTVCRKDRDSRGGGVAILFREHLHAFGLPDIVGVKCVIIKVALDEFSLIVGGFYRPPNR